jgi:hypothetical protein
MPFPTEIVRVPTAIGDMRIEIIDPTGVPSEITSVFYIEILDQNGNVIRAISGNLAPHLTPAQITGALTLLAALRAKAVDEILP